MKSDRKLKVLHIEDSKTDAEWVREAIGEHVEIYHVTELKDAHAIGSCDVALLDLHLPDSFGLETIEKFVRGAGHIPIVVLTHIDDPVVESKCIQLGAHAYYRKGTFDPAALIRAMEAAAISYYSRSRDESEIAVHKSSLEEIRVLTAGILKRIEDLKK